MSEIKNYGFIAPVITPDNYVLGGYSKIKGQIINPSGNWIPYLPVVEPQSKRGIETQACASYGTLNALETLFKFIFGLIVNYSDRALAKASETDPERGNDPNKVAETVRKLFGCVVEATWPFKDGMTLQEYYAELSGYIIEEGRKWIGEWSFGHEWVFQGGTLKYKQEQLLEALKRSPVGVSVLAWQMGDKGMYVKPVGAPDTHWCLLVNAVQGEYWEVFDSYDTFIKKLEWDYDFGFAKVYYISKAVAKLSIMAQIMAQIVAAIAKIVPILSLLISKKKEELAPLPIDADPPPPVKVEPLPARTESKIEAWAKAIQKEEGWFSGSRSFRNNNPGNMKASNLVRSFGSEFFVGGYLQADKDGFAVFDTYTSGFKALCEFLTFAAKDELKDYHNDRTLLLFTKKYALPPNDNYAKGVANALKVDVHVDIGTLI